MLTCACRRVAQVFQIVGEHRRVQCRREGALLDDEDSDCDCTCVVCRLASTMVSWRDKYAAPAEAHNAEAVTCPVQGGSGDRQAFTSSHGPSNARAASPAPTPPSLAALPQSPLPTPQRRGKQPRNFQPQLDTIVKDTSGACATDGMDAGSDTDSGVGAAVDAVADATLMMPASPVASAATSEGEDAPLEPPSSALLDSTSCRLLMLLACCRSPTDVSMFAAQFMYAPSVLPPAPRSGSFTIECCRTTFTFKSWRTQAQTACVRWRTSMWGCEQP